MKKLVLALLWETPFGRIEIWQNEEGSYWELRLDGGLQWTSRDEHRYHQLLFGFPPSLLDREIEVLVLGGGDGLGVRELLKWDHVKKILLIDISPQMVSLAKTDPRFVQLNLNSLNSPKVEIVIDDALFAVKKLNKSFDLVIADYPDPSAEENNQVNRLFSNEHFKDIKKLLKKDGVFALQATSAFVSPNVYRWIYLQLKEVGFTNILPLRINTPAWGDVSFYICNLERELSIKKPLKGFFFNEDTVKYLIPVFEDEKPTFPDEVLKTKPLHEIVYYDLNLHNPSFRYLKGETK